MHLQKHHYQWSHQTDHPVSTKDIKVSRKLASANRMRLHSYTPPAGWFKSSLAVAQSPPGHHRYVATGSTFGSIPILSIIVFSCEVSCQASFRPLPLGLFRLISFAPFSFWDRSTGGFSIGDTTYFQGLCQVMGTHGGALSSLFEDWCMVSRNSLHCHIGQIHVIRTSSDRY